MKYAGPVGPERAGRRFGLARLVAALTVSAAVCSPGPIVAQGGAPSSPHAAKPERPTVATHAYTVAPGWIELEAGMERQKAGALANRLAMPLVLKIGLGTHLQLDIVPGWERDAQGGGAESGVTDVLAGVKWRLTDAAPVLGAFAIQTTVSLPTGDAGSGRGSGKAAMNVLLISSHNIGPASLDVNAGYTRLGGESASAPRDSTVWAAAAALPLTGHLGWSAEIFGYPGTSGPNGSPPVMGFLTGPTFTVCPSVVLDAGAIFDIEGFGGTSVYAGVTWNIGRIWRSPSHQSRHPPPPTPM
jgi:hypothetical protein